ncbi:unnamed protein product, partial [Ectocarpus sp. 8 AP-2014]
GGGRGSEGRRTGVLWRGRRRRQRPAQPGLGGRGGGPQGGRGAGEGASTPRGRGHDAAHAREAPRVRRDQVHGHVSGDRHPGPGAATPPQARPHAQRRRLPRRRGAVAGDEPPRGAGRAPSRACGKRERPWEWKRGRVEGAGGGDGGLVLGVSGHG